MRFCPDMSQAQEEREARARLRLVEDEADFQDLQEAFSSQSIFEDFTVPIGIEQEITEYEMRRREFHSHEARVWLRVLRFQYDRHSINWKQILKARGFKSKFSLAHQSLLAMRYRWRAMAKSFLSPCHGDPIALQSMQQHLILGRLSYQDIATSLLEVDMFRANIPC